MSHLVRYLLVALMLSGTVASAQTRTTLDIYTIDVEGGKAVLVVTPAGESMLIDAGWPPGGNRPSSNDRILDAFKLAGLKQLDYLLISHFDVDHIGDVPALAAAFPIRHVLDHGEIQLPPAPAAAPAAAPRAGGPAGPPAGLVRFNAYADWRKTVGHTVLKPGDKLPLKGVDIEVLTSGGQLVTRSTVGSGVGAANQLCSQYTQVPRIERDVEDDQSVGLLYKFGEFRMLDLADLEAHLSYDLACPANRVGTVDVYHVNVHGQFKGLAPALIGGIRPTVAIMGNGARKGADPTSWPVLRGTPGLEDIWQVHYSAPGTDETNPPADFIANLEGTPDAFAMIKIAVQSDGTYTITNTRNGFSKTYRAGMVGGKKKS